MSRDRSRRSLLALGLTCVAAAPLLDAGVLLRWFAPFGLRESPATTMGAAFLQTLLFLGGTALLFARRRLGLPAGTTPWGTIVACSLSWLGFHGALIAFERHAGVAAVLLAGLALLLLLLVIRWAGVLVLAALGAGFPWPRFRRPILFVISLTVVLAAIELLLGVLAHRRIPVAPNAVAARVVMPDALARREVQVPGAKAAWYWQGKLHLFDAEGFRRATPFPPKPAGVFRILAVGDSLTYGQGVAVEDAWPAVLERELGRECRVEVLNLGICGLQSEGVREILERFLPRLEADLVIYGVCLNDFLPGWRPQYANNRAWTLRLPYGFHLEHGTRVGAFFAERYDRLLMRIGVRADFTTDILRDFDHYQERFARDVAAMNRLVTARGLPPLIAIVLDQSPDTRGKGYAIDRLAERYLREGGLQVVPADYIRANDGRRDLVVSRWEAHPNEEAHRIFAGALLGVVRGDVRLARYRLAR